MRCLLQAAGNTVFQSLRALPSPDVGDNVAYGLRIGRRFEEDTATRVKECADDVDDGASEKKP